MNTMKLTATSLKSNATDFMFVGPFVLQKPKSFLPDRDITAKSFLHYNIHGTGVLTSSGFQARGLFSSSFSKKFNQNQISWPDVQLQLSSTAVHQSFISTLAHIHGLNETIMNQYYAPHVGKDSFHILISVGRPKSKGEMRLASSNPNDPLILDPKYLSDPQGEDFKIMLEALKTSVKIVEDSSEFDKLGAKFTAQVFPGCENMQFRSDAYWECYVKHYTVSLNHQVGTCAMGRDNGDQTVVDSQLRVKGVKNLRVVDASVSLISYELSFFKQNK